MAEQLGPAPEPSSTSIVPQLLALVFVVTVKIPPFWPANPQVQFAQVEAQFVARNATSHRTKFYHVVTVLVPESSPSPTTCRHPL